MDGSVVGVLIAFLMIIAVFWVVIAMIVRSSKDKKRMKHKAVELGATDIVPALHWEGLGLNLNAPCELYLFPEKLVLEHGNQKFEIPIDRIRAAEFKSEQELREKGKSVVGRAVIGTLLVPGLGTIVGGMSGIGNKKVKSRLNHFLIINYTNAAGELTGVTLFNNLNIIRLQAFANGINRVLQLQHKESSATIIL